MQAAQAYNLYGRSCLHENKSSIKVIVSGIYADRNMSFASGMAGVSNGYRNRSGHSWDYYNLCDLMYGRGISGRENHQKREISLGCSGRALIFRAFGNGFVYCGRKLGYESGASPYNSLYVPWWRYTWRNVILIKKCFYLV